MLGVAPLSLALLLALGGCATSRESNPPRTATEQLLISSAADRAARDLAIRIPVGAKVFVDASYVDGTDSKYAVAALREQVLRRGGNLVAGRPAAEVVVELRAGALSTDEDQTLVGMPETDIPIPLAGELGLPELALFKKDRTQGVAKFAAVAYDAKDGDLIAASEPRFGYAHKTDWVVLLFFAWTTNDILPEGKAAP